MPSLTSENGFVLSFDAESEKLTLEARSRDGSVWIATAISATDRPEVVEGLAEIAEMGRAMENGGDKPQRLGLLAARTEQALEYFAAPLRNLARWVVTSQENTNFTYDISPHGITTLSHAVSLATGAPVADIRGYLAEPADDPAFLETLRLKGTKLAQTLPFDAEPRFGRRLGWYAAARALKPRVILESGIDKGLGAMLLCYALERNAEEGHPGRYLGLDINPASGALMSQPYSRHAEFHLGDALESIAALTDPIDLYINDGDHRHDYEAREYQAIAPKLAPECLILGDNCHLSEALPRFAEATDRRFFFWREQPADHWYPGAGIGFALAPQAR